MTTTILITSTSGTGITMRTRQIHESVGGPLRCPHHTVSRLGALSELALAAGGVLYLDETLEFNRQVIRDIVGTWKRMDPRVRPVLVLGMRFVRPDWLPQFPSKDDLALVEALPPIDQHEVVDSPLKTLGAVRTEAEQAAR